MNESDEVLAKDRVWLRERGSVTFAAFYGESDTLAAPASGWTAITNPAAVEGASLITITRETWIGTPPSVTHGGTPAMIGVAVGIKPRPRPPITIPRPAL